MFLKADIAVLYGKVVEVVNECRKTGVEKIGLMTEKEK
jgi:biopolymer transport protein ExbD